MAKVYVLLIDDSRWVREDDYRKLEQQLVEAQAALKDLLEWLPEPRHRPLGLDWVFDKHAAALKAAREAK